MAGECHGTREIIDGIWEDYLTFDLSSTIARSSTCVFSSSGMIDFLQFGQAGSPAVKEWPQLHLTSAIGAIPDFLKAIIIILQTVYFEITKITVLILEILHEIAAFLKLPIDTAVGISGLIH